MIKKFEDLGLEDVDTDEVVQAKVLDKLGLQFEEMTKKLSSYVQKNATILVENMINIIPFGDYDFFLEEKDKMAEFLVTEASQEKHWKLQSVGTTHTESEKELISFYFLNKAVDDGDVLIGYVYSNYQGKLMHAFVQNNG